MRGESAAAVAAAAAAAAARPGKRPLRALSAAEKMEAIQRVHEGESKASVARDIGVPESTLRGWCKSEHKIRGMARNSSTPDSEAAHSPASSSGGNPATSSGLGLGSAMGGHNNSEDESGVSPPKRMRTDETHYASSATDLTANGYKTTSSDYLNLLNNLISTGSVSPTQGALLCQQLGLFQTATTKQQSQQLSFVENGLQYSSSSSKSHKRASTSSAIAPTSHVDSVSKSGATRKSLPAAAEAPLTSLPLSPRRGDTTSMHHQQQQQQQQSLHHYNQLAPSSSSNVNSSSSSSKRDQKIDPALLLWLDHQQQYMSQKTPVSLSNTTTTTDWFWQYCKNYGGAALLAAATNLVNLNSASVSANMNSSGSGSGIEQVAATTTTTTTTASSTTSEAAAAAAVASSDEAAGGGKSNKKYKHHHSMRKSPSKARALVEDAVCINNNNECARRSLNLESMDDDVVAIQPQQQQQQPTTTTTEAKEDKEEESNISFEEALQHARIFSKWLENYRDPTVCVSQIVQFRVMLNNLEKKNNTTSPVVGVRRTRKKTPQSISQ